MTAPIPTTPDAREQARLLIEASLERNEQRATAAARFGSPAEQRSDRRANLAALLADGLLR
jgi:hypothetical protein